MAETHFFMSQNDSLSFVAFLIDLACAEFVPEQSTEPPPFPRYTTLAQVQQRLDQGKHYSRFFVLSTEWELHPLVFNEIHANDGRHFHRVSLQHGGPAFDFILSRVHANDNVQWIVPGSFSDYSFYIQDESFLSDHSRYRTFDRPEKMTRTHNEVRKYLRRNGRRSVCQETKHVGPWILPGALNDHLSGTWLRIGDLHFEPTAR